MKKIILKRLELHYFKNWVDFALDFNETSNIIKAPFGYGKSSIYESFIYVLGLTPQCEITSKCEDKQETSVKATFLIDNQEYTFTRRNTNKCVINEIPYNTLKSYQTQIESILDIDLVNLELLCVLEKFNQDTSKWKWVNRLQYLKDLFKAENKLKELQDSYDDLKNLFNNGLTETDIQSKILSTKRKLKTQLETLGNLRLDKIKKLKELQLDSEEQEFYDSFSEKEKTLMREKESKRVEVEDLKLQKEVFIKTLDNLISKEIALDAENLANNKCLVCGSIITRVQYENAKFGQKKALNEEIEQVSKNIDNLHRNITVLENDISSLECTLKDLTKKYDNIVVKVIQYNTIDNDLKDIERQIKDLNTEEQNNALLEQNIEDYINKSVDILDNAINNNFKNGIKWKLFEKRKEGYDNCCELLYQNREYSILSFGEKINANYYLNKYLQKAFNISLPTFIDNANAYKVFTPNDMQTILLITTENDCNIDLRNIRLSDL